MPESGDISGSRLRTKTGSILNTCYLGLGSNQKFPERQIRQAIKEIKRLPATYVTKVSTLFWNKAWGFYGQQDFCNVVIEIITFLPPLLLLQKCKKIEKAHGRIRKKFWGPRTMDIDIILFKDRNIKTKNFVVPHPHMLSRDFVMKPLLEINPRIKFYNTEN